MKKKLFFVIISIEPWQLIKGMYQPTLKSPFKTQIATNTSREKIKKSIIQELNDKFIKQEKEKNKILYQNVMKELRIRHAKNLTIKELKYLDTQNIPDIAKDALVIQNFNYSLEFLKKSKKNQLNIPLLLENKSTWKNDEILANCYIQCINDLIEDTIKTTQNYLVQICTSNINTEKIKDARFDFIKKYGSLNFYKAIIDDNKLLFNIEVLKNPTLILLLTTMGGNINSKKGDYGCTPLHYVVTWDKKYTLHTIETIKLLISLGSDINSKNMDGFTPLHYAMTNPNWEIIKLLIKNKANPDCQNISNITPFNIATFWTKIYIKFLQTFN